MYALLAGVDVVGAGGLRGMCVLLCVYVCVCTCFCVMQDFEGQRKSELVYQVIEVSFAVRHTVGRQSRRA